MTEPTALDTDAGRRGLRGVVVSTSVGPVTVHEGRRRGGAALVLLHGAAARWTTWVPLLDAGDRDGEPLADVVAVDLPGWGGSGERVPSLEHLSDALVEILRTLGYARWRVIGHSLGGFVALDIAARHPAETLGVGLVSPSGGSVLDVLRRPVRGGLRLPGLAGMILAMHVLHGLGGAARPLLRALRATGLLRLLAAPLFRHPRTIDRSVTDALAEEIRPHAFLRAARAARTYDDRRWRRIRCPVRAVSGERDVFSLACDDAWFARRIGDFDAVRLTNAGHYAAVEQPRAVLRALRDVLPKPETPALARPANALRGAARS
jgi:pimeloyl-ACP methyl ester carboxylesterase